MIVAIFLARLDYYGQAETVAVSEENLTDVRETAGGEEAGLADGWRVQNGFQVYIENGRRVCGRWVGDYYLNENGILTENAFLVFEGKLYHAGSSGACDRGRFFHDGVEYFANSEGVIHTSTWVPDGDNWIYVDENGAILKNEVTPDGYLVDAEGLVLDDGYGEYQGFQYSEQSLRLNTGAADRIWSYLKKRGWTDTAIAGLLGNFQQESHLSPSLQEAGGDGFGLGQWSYDRREAMEAYAKGLGKPVNDLYMQLDYLMVEPGESRFVKDYMKTEFSSAAEAAINWCTGWERPNKLKARLGSVRIPYAMAYYEHYVHGTDYLTEAYDYEDPIYAEEETEGTAAEAEAEPQYTPLFDEEGNMTLGWIYDAGGWWYRYPGGIYAQNEWKQIDGEWYYFGPDGYMESDQWITDHNGDSYHLDAEGHIIPSDEELAQQAATPVITAGGAATASDAEAASESETPSEIGTLRKLLETEN